MKITIRTITLIVAWLLGSISYGVQASCTSDSSAQKESNLLLNLDSLSLGSETTGSQNLSLSSGTFSCDYEWVGRVNRVAIVSEMTNSTAYINYGNYVLQFVITNIEPMRRDYSRYGEKNISGSSFNNVAFTYKTKLLKSIPADANPKDIYNVGANTSSVTLYHALSVVDTSGYSFWFPGVNLSALIKWILGLIGSDEEKRLFYQNITINYRPHVSTCSIPDTTVTLPETDLTSLISAGKEAQFYENFTLHAECSDLLEGMSTRTIQFYLSSASVDTDKYTLKNTQGTARNIGVRIMRADSSKKVAISQTELTSGNITSEYELHKIKQWGSNYDIPLRAYYYIYGANPTEGIIQTTAKVNIIYP
ncbi:fimbrial protein [Klebsiella aerogenes]|nr:fimbrial protein [Klebsiella aerogenes]